MEKDWELVYSLDKSYKAEMAKQLLESDGISVVIINKKDTTYTSFGEFEVYVSKESAVKAREILERSEL